MKNLLIVAAMGMALLVSSTALADTLSGSCRNKSGEKCTSIHRISTSWNSKSAVPSGIGDLLMALLRHLALQDTPSAHPPLLQPQNVG